MSFPASPANNQISVVNGISYVYNTANRSWTRTSGLSSNVTIGTLAVSNTLTGNVITANTIAAPTIQATGANPTGLGTGALQVTAGGASIMQDLWVGGNIYANVINTVSTQTLQVNEPLVFLQADGTESTYTTYNYDAGVYTHFWGGPANIHAYTGLIRHYTDNTWYLASNLAAPAGNTVAVTSSTIVLDTLKLGSANVANTTVSVSATTGALVVGGGAGIAGNVNIAGNVAAGLVTATNGLHLNSNVINSNVNIPQGYNAFAIGPISMSSGVSITMASGSRYVVI